MSRRGGKKEEAVCFGKGGEGKQDGVRSLPPGPEAV